MKRAKLVGLQWRVCTVCNQDKRLVGLVSVSISELGAEIYCYRRIINGVA